MTCRPCSTSLKTRYSRSPTPKVLIQTIHAGRVINNNIYPLAEEIRSPPPAEELFQRLAGLPYCLFLDSAARHPTLGRYSFLAADPFDVALVPADGSDALQLLQEKMQRFAAERSAGLPPFQGGAAGLFGYDLGRSIERIPRTAYDEFQVPALAVGLYDVTIAFDHLDSRAWIISQGFPELEPSRRARRAAERLAWFADLIKSRPSAKARKNAGATDAGDFMLAPQFPTQHASGVTSNFSKDDYLHTVGRVIDYILAGDVFQVNLSQRLLAPARDDSVSLYLRLRHCNPAPFAGYFDMGGQQVVSASPERFVQVLDREVEARPIKGTRPRVAVPEADRLAEAELMASEKDRAENVMIVDLLRNDISRTCQPDSVKVGQLCEIEAYEHVLHLVSSVVGRLRDGCSPLDLVRCAFPGGSITGAPKVRAMEIIAELEPTARGAYCGSLGYIGFDGSTDLSILIRTITAAGGWWQFPVGGGIVAQSTPEGEYDETWHKAEGMLRAL